MIHPPMELQLSLNEFRDLLARWAHWLYQANRQSLGYSRSSYSEYIGVGSFGRDPIDDIDPDVMRWDQCFRTSIPDEFREVIDEHYLRPRVRNPDAVARRDGRHYEKRKVVEVACITLFRVFKERLP